MEVLMEEQGLDHSCEEEKDSVDIAMPVRVTLILGEIDHQPVSSVYVYIKLPILLHVCCVCIIII